jgi:Ser/Thr protein kinase RdoA (MazF antagonist)
METDPAPVKALTLKGYKSSLLSGEFMDGSFYQLTPDIVIRAAEEGGLEPTGHCMTLNSFENRVFDLMLEDGSHAVLKFYRPGRWSREQILEEHEFLFDLAADEIPACVPMRFPDGSTLRSSDGILYTMWPRTGGRQADELSDDEIMVLGRLLARIHNNGAAKQAPHRAVLEADSFALEPLEFLLSNNFLPSHCAQRYEHAARRIIEIYSELSRGVPLHRIHGDCHLGNLLKGRDGWFFLDFDDFLTGPAVQDVWMLLPSRDRESLRQRELFLDAYRRFRDFDERWLRLIELLRAIRYIRYAAWIARRWNDPAFPKAFPHFGTVQYWEEETKDLQEQLSVILEEQDGGIPADETPSGEELTNKDFFWDWEK